MTGWHSLAAFCAVRPFPLSDSYSGTSPSADSSWFVVTAWRLYVSYMRPQRIRPSLFTLIFAWFTCWQSNGYRVSTCSADLPPISRPCINFLCVKPRICHRLPSDAACNNALVFDYALLAIRVRVRTWPCRAYRRKSTLFIDVHLFSSSFSLPQSFKLVRTQRILNLSTAMLHCNNTLCHCCPLKIVDG